MAGHGYTNRSHNRYNGFDPRKTERSHNFEQLRCPSLDEFEGRGMIADGPYENTGNYVMTIETTVERIHPPMSSEFYRQYSPPGYEHCPSYGVVNNKPHRPSIPSNDRPPVVEEFFNKIQNEVSQPSGFGGPRAPNRLRIPVSAGCHGTTSDWPPVVEEFSNKIQNEVSQPCGFGAPRAPYHLRIPVSAGYNGTTAEDGDRERERHKPITNTTKGEEPHWGDHKADKILKPPVMTEGGYGARPGHPTGSVLPSHHISSERERTIQPPSMIMGGRWERRLPSTSLSKPMSDIDMAMEYLKNVVDPSSVNTIKDEVPDRGNFKINKVPKPPLATEGGPAGRPGHPTGSMLPNNYISSERGERTIQPPSMTMTGGRERRGHGMGPEPTNETGKIMEFPKEAAKPSSGSTVPKRDSIPETIDSKEARRRYGNVNSSPELYSTGHTATIDSREAVRKYKGEFV